MTKTENDEPNDEPKKDARLEELPPPALFAPEDRITGCTIELETPVEFGGTITELVFQPLRGIHVRGFPKEFSSIGKFLDVAEMLTQQPTTVFDRLVGDDVGRVFGATQASIWPALELPNASIDEEGNLVRGPLPKLVSPFTLTLSAPITDKKTKRTVAELVYTPVTGAIARTFAGNTLPVKALPKLIERLAHVPAGIVDQLEGMDLRDALGVATCFFGSIQPITPGSSER